MSAAKIINKEAPMKQLSVDEFAAYSLTILAQSQMPPEDVAVRAYDIAEAMVAERERRYPEKSTTLDQSVVDSLSDFRRKGSGKLFPKNNEGDSKDDFMRSVVCTINELSGTNER